MLPAARDMKPGVFCFNPPYGVRMGAEQAKRSCSRSTPTWAAPSRASAAGARPVSSRTRSFVEAFGHPPAMTKPASNAELRGNFLVFQL